MAFVDSRRHIEGQGDIVVIHPGGGACEGECQGIGSQSAGIAQVQTS